MRFDISFERTYPHPVATVWRALTDPALLGRWLMETDFVAEPGREFRMWCENAEGGRDRYLCRVLEYEPPRRMLWSWVLDGRQGEGATHVEFTLTEVAQGTHLTVRHTGDRDPNIIEAFKGGWPVKLDQLDAALGPDG